MRSEDSGEDPYLSALGHLGKVLCLPTLAFNFVNFSDLKRALSNYYQWSSIIFTSKRAVEAVGLAIDEDKLCGWKSKPCFVVGEATRRAAEQIGFRCEGEQSGSAASLGPVIKELYDKDQHLPILFVCGRSRMDVLPEFLIGNGIPHEEVVVYETGSDPLLRKHIESFIDLYGPPTHLVYFSPSGFRFAHRHWERALSRRLDGVIVIAIGKSTAAEVTSSGLSVRTANKPNPASVLDVISPRELTSPT